MKKTLFILATVFYLNTNAQTGSALDFDGVNDYVATTSTVSISGSSARTLEFWANMTSANLNQTAHLANWGTTNTAYESFGLWIYQGYLRFFGWAAGDYVTGYLLTSGWHHYAVTYDGTSVNTYVDGVPTATTNIARALNTPATPLVIGSRVVDHIYPFAGQIDEVKIYNKALTQSEIVTKMNCEVASNDTNLIDYYNFNEGIVAANNATVTVLLDAVTPANNGTLTNFALSGTASNWVSPGGVVSGTSCTSTTGIKTLNVHQSAFQVYPNPSNGNFVITATDNTKTILVTDILGNELLSINPNSTTTNINLSTQPNGVYFIKVISENAQTVKRIIINN